MAQKSTVSEVSRRYTEALYSLARQNFDEVSVATDLGVLSKQINGSADLKRVFNNPAISTVKKVNICKKLRTKLNISDITGKFLCLLAKKGRLNLLNYILEQYTELLARGRGETKVEVISAHRLDSQEISSLKSQLEGLTGSKIFIDNKIDKNIIAGLVIKIGSNMVDFSVLTKLKRITHLMEDA